jgi:hypothetical protein
VTLELVPALGSTTYLPAAGFALDRTLADETPRLIEALEAGAAAEGVEEPVCWWSELQAAAWVATTVTETRSGGWLSRQWRRI